MSHAAPCGVPSWESYGAQAPAGGNGFMGAIIQANSSTIIEYIEEHLPCPLLSSQKYNISFKAARASGSTCSSGNIGLWLTTGQVVSTATAQSIAGPPTFTASCSSSAWTTFTYSPTYGGNQNYITIGDFSAPGGCTNPAINYYYIDDVVIAPIPPTLSTTANPVCKYNTVTLSETGSPNNSNTKWYDPTGALIGTGWSVTFTATTSGTYSCIVNVGNACCTNLMSTITLTVNTSGITVSGSTVTCQNTAVTLTASGGTPTYTWTPGGTTGNTYTVTASTVGANTVVVKGGNCGYGTYTVTVNATPTITAVASPTAICSGSTSTLTSSGASTYTWNPGGATTATVAVTPSVTTIYTVTGTNSLTCTNTKTVTVNVTTTPTVAVTPTVATVCYGSNAASLTASGATNRVNCFM
jgi:hypothetical protein